MKKILPLLLLATLAMLALPHLALAGEHTQNMSQNHSSETNDVHEGSNSDHNQAGKQQHEDEGVNASFQVRLVGSQQVKAVSTIAFGFAKIELIGNTTLEFSLVVCDIANVTHAHIHVGAAGTNGPIVIHFFDEPTYPFSVTDGCETLAAGIRTPSDLTTASEAGINNWNNFVHALLTNNTYVNVHTTANPNGEIRGQLILHAEHEQDHDNQPELAEAKQSET